MKSMFTFLFMFLLVSAVAFAENYEFEVTHCKGNPSLYKINGQKNWLKLTVGTKLTSADEILIKSGSYIGLRHKSGKTEVLTKAKMYSVSKLSAEVAQRKSEISKRFADYFLSEVGSADDRLTKQDHTRRMKTGGHVSRYVGEKEGDKAGSVTNMAGVEADRGILNLTNSFLNDDNVSLIARLPRTTYLIDDQTMFSWYSHPDIETYTLKISDRQGNIIKSITLKDTCCIIDLNNIKMQKGENYYWTVSGNDIVSDEYCINRLDDLQLNKLNNEIETIRKEFDADSDPMGLLVLASVYEDYNIMDKAIEMYNKAVQASDNNEDFQQLYAQYLFRIGLADEASAILWAHN